MTDSVLGEQRLTIHLLAESENLQDWGQEIAQLKLSSINFYWIRKPSECEIVFDGPDPYRIWYCSYKDGNFFGLQFDD